MADSEQAGFPLWLALRIEHGYATPEETADYACRKSVTSTGIQETSCQDNCTRDCTAGCTRDCTAGCTRDCTAGCTRDCTAGSG
jgi:hypothetical protein